MFLEDQLQLEKKGISIEKIENQINHFKYGFEFINITRPAAINDGIIKYSNDEIAELINHFEQAIDQGLTIEKFIPASGAASRMFKLLFDFINQTHKNAIHNNQSKEFIDNVTLFPFASELQRLTGIDFAKPINLDDALVIVKALLNEHGLNYGNLPKGVLKFHASKTNARTPIEEHMLEGALHCKDKHNTVALHFTVSPEHESLFKKVVDEGVKYFEDTYQVKYNVTFSHQKSSTDTLAVKPDNTPFRLKNGELCFRPAGHGALIENLKDLNSDIIFIKNIDNVIQEHLLSDTITYKKVLGGKLYKVRKHLFNILHLLNDASEITIRDSIVPSLNAIHIIVPPTILMQHGEHLNRSLFAYLNRPIRVCGMVKNEGEPGGGPFWVEDNEGNSSLQIVESSQIDLKNQKYLGIMNQSSYFNPVDLVCSIKDYKGDKFDLSLYVDPDTGFISEKSLSGAPLKALELPGLWNGAMAHWLTIFIEVPLTTFNPVKTINDLLRKQHQPE